MLERGAWSPTRAVTRLIRRPVMKYVDLYAVKFVAERRA
jgi:hypothetical protein